MDNKGAGHSKQLAHAISIGAKKKALLYMDSETVQNAKELDLNLSKVAENALKEAVRHLEGAKFETDC